MTIAAVKQETFAVSVIAQIPLIVHTLKTAAVGLMELNIIAIGTHQTMPALLVSNKQGMKTKRTGCSAVR